MFTFTSRATMSRATVVVLALTGLSFLNCAVSASPISPLGGAHSKDEIRSTCAANGGTFGSNDETGGYGCYKEGGGTVTCKKNGKCEGWTDDAPAPGHRKTGTLGGGLRAPEGGVTLKPVSSPPPKRAVGPVRVNPPVAVSSNPGSGKPTVGTIYMARAHHK
jgi:hypothetical protein